MQSNFYCLLTFHLFNTEITNTRHIVLQATHTALADSGICLWVIEYCIINC